MTPQTGFRFADRTRARHAAVHALLAAGHSRRAVQRQLGMTWRTVKALADAVTPEDLFQLVIYPAVSNKLA
ncbi:hypothetical protein ACIOGZ_29815 [Kitasatospora sp. NPDC088160]|uniref:hypothetical protein n=1 Tax=Kitasatospora sp. NPDC088160 TaxID=3364072 RepID=UPI003809A5D8